MQKSIYLFLFISLLNFNLYSTVSRTPTPKQTLLPEEKQTINVFEEASSSVVYITTTQKVRDYWSRNIFTIPKGSGSGFVWDKNGHIITNFHVISGASEATILFNDGKKYKASLVGYSREHDIAVLKIESDVKLLKPIKLGTSHDLKVGQKVLAIGNPFGLDYTLTSGIISALNRTLDADKDLSINNLIQTDAAINPGNSGGPLLDSSGRLIGINTAIYSPSGASAGIGFAVPADTVNRIVPSLIKNGRYKRPTLGIGVNQSLNTFIQKEYNIKGVLVLNVQENSQAQKAGLRGSSFNQNNIIELGDVIIAIDKSKIEDVKDLLLTLEKYQINETINLTILRDKRKLTIPITLQ